MPVVLAQCPPHPGWHTYPVGGRAALHHWAKGCHLSLSSTSLQIHLLRDVASVEASVLSDETVVGFSALEWVGEPSKGLLRPPLPTFCWAEDSSAQEANKTC